jgi:pyridoxal phosphate enzyme (YggS family)
MTIDPFIANRAAVEEKISAACIAAGRERAEIRVLPVTKTVSATRLRPLLEQGFFQECGENKVQEAREKQQALADLPCRFTLIGPLQSNKVKYLPDFIQEFQALDNLKIAEALDRHYQKAGKSLKVFIEINSSGEASKFGLAPEDALAFSRALTVFQSLQVVGLMTLAIFSEDSSKVRACFQVMRQLQAQLQQDAPSNCSFKELSMGMSNDFPLAIAEGATCLRLGTALFGTRAT